MSKKPKNEVLSKKTKSGFQHQFESYILSQSLRPLYFTSKQRKTLISERETNSKSLFDTDSSMPNPHHLHKLSNWNNDFVRTMAQDPGREVIKWLGLNDLLALKLTDQSTKYTLQTRQFFEYTATIIDKNACWVSMPRSFGSNITKVTFTNCIFLLQHFQWLSSLTKLVYLEFFNCNAHIRQSQIKIHELVGPNAVIPVLFWKILKDFLDISYMLPSSLKNLRSEQSSILKNFEMNDHNKSVIQNLDSIVLDFNGTREFDFWLLSISSSFGKNAPESMKLSSMILTSTFKIWPPHFQFCPAKPAPIKFSLFPNLQTLGFHLIHDPTEYNRASNERQNDQSYRSSMSYPLNDEMIEFEAFSQLKQFTHVCNTVRILGFINNNYSIPRQEMYKLYLLLFHQFPSTEGIIVDNFNDLAVILSINKLESDPTIQGLFSQKSTHQLQAILIANHSSFLQCESEAHFNTKIFIKFSMPDKIASSNANRIRKFEHMKTPSNYNQNITDTQMKIMSQLDAFSKEMQMKELVL